MKRLIESLNQPRESGENVIMPPTKTWISRIFLSVIDTLDRFQKPFKYIKCQTGISTDPLLYLYNRDLRYLEQFPALGIMMMSYNFYHRLFLYNDLTKLQ